MSDRSKTSMEGTNSLFQPRIDDEVSGLREEALAPRIVPTFARNELVESPSFANETARVLRQSENRNVTVVELPQRPVDYFATPQAIDETTLKKFKVDNSDFFYDHKGKVYEAVEPGRYLPLDNMQVVRTDTLKSRMQPMAEQHRPDKVEFIDGNGNALPDPKGARKATIHRPDGTIIYFDPQKYEFNLRFEKFQRFDDKYVTRIDGKAYLVTAEGSCFSQTPTGSFIESNYKVARHGTKMQRATDFVDEQGKLRLPNDEIVARGRDIEVKNGQDIIKLREQPSDSQRTSESRIWIGADSGDQAGINKGERICRLYRKSDGTVIRDEADRLGGFPEKFNKTEYLGAIPEGSKVIRLDAVAYIVTPDGRVLSQDRSGKFFLENRFQVKSLGDGGMPAHIFEYKGKLQIPRDFSYDSVGIAPAGNRIGSDPMTPVEREPVDRLTNRELAEVRALREKLEAKGNLSESERENARVLRYGEREFAGHRPDAKLGIDRVRNILKDVKAGKSGAVAVILLSAAISSHFRTQQAPSAPMRMSIH